MTDKPITLADWAARLPPPELRHFDLDAITNEFLRDYVPPKVSWWWRIRWRTAEALERLSRWIEP